MQTKTAKNQIFSEPFPHFIIHDFLNPDQYKIIVQIYNKLPFKKKQSDLFQFFQTDQLNTYKKLGLFRQELDKQFWQLSPMKEGTIKKQDTFYNIFASYYFKGNYLLCHDDVIEDRLYAFSYYLEDFDSGDLVFFNKQANKQVKRIKVKKNTLAIFEVSNYSYHEVDFTNTDGRKAVTGWFNIKGLGNKRIHKVIPPYVPYIPPKDESLEFELPKEYFSEEYFQLMDIKYQFNVKQTRLEGPFFCRRVHKISLDQTVVFKLPGYKLYSAEFYSFEIGDYILLNDPINTIQGYDIIDVFVTHLPYEFDNQEDTDNYLVKILQEDDQDVNGIPESHDNLFVIHRGEKQYCVERCSKPFKLAHFVYEKIIKHKRLLKNGFKIVTYPQKKEKIQKIQKVQKKIQKKATIQNKKKKNKASRLKNMKKLVRKQKVQDKKPKKQAQPEIKSKNTRKIKRVGK